MQEINESLLSYIWQFQVLRGKLFTQQGESIQVIKRGQLNLDAGPDFSCAELRIGNTHWAGNIEIHCKSSDWHKHKHHTNSAYSTVILHVVYEHDEDVLVAGQIVPTLALKPYISEEFLKKHGELSLPIKEIPCEKQHYVVDPFHKQAWFTKLLVSRFSRKAELIQQQYLANAGNLEETAYQFLLKTFGLSVNADAAFALALHLPLALMQKYSTNSLALEALLFGVAGFLNEKHTDRYYLDLQKEFLFLKQKHGLKQMKVSAWKFMRMRPANFPTIRLAQFAQMLTKESNYLFFFKPNLSKAEFVLWADIEINSYWDTHYVFGKETAMQVKHIGEQFLQQLYINFYLPFQFFYARLRGDSDLDNVLSQLEAWPAERNKLSSQMERANFENKQAAHSQALLELNSYFCSQKKCLSCNIGFQLLNKSTHE